MNSYRRRSWLVAVTFGAFIGCDGPTDTGAPIAVVISTPSAGELVRVLPVDVAGTIVGSDDATLSYTINGAGPVTPPGVVRTGDGAFRFTIAELPAGEVSIEVAAVDGRREASASVALEYAPVTLTATPDVNGVRYGTVMPFSGTVSDASVVVRYSLNGAPDQDVDVFPGAGPRPYRGEAHPLRPGPNVIVVRAYSGDDVVATSTFAVDAEIPSHAYGVEVVSELPDGAEIPVVRAGNDGRVAGWWDTGPFTAYAFTWRDGVFTHLSQMGQIADVNNVGQVLGYKAPLTSGSSSLIWKDGAYTALTNPPSAALINDYGHVAGSNPGIWRDGVFEPYTLGTFAIVDMNNHGAMIANDLTSRSFVAWLNPPTGQHVALPMFSRSAARRISDGGHVLYAGQVSAASASRSVIWHAGVSTDLNAIVGFRFDASAVNAVGTVAGAYTHGSEVRVATWQDGRTTDVMLASSQWEPISVRDITDAGQILVLAQEIDGSRRAVLLLTPPE